MTVYWKLHLLQHNLLQANSTQTITSFQACTVRVTIHPGFPGHILFFGPCPGGFSENRVYIQVMHIGTHRLPQVSKTQH